MLDTAQSSLTGHSSNLMFMRRRQAAQLLLALADGPMKSAVTQNLLLDALHQLPTQCFIADDWHDILLQVTEMLLRERNTDGARMPTQLSQLLTSLQNRLQH